MKHHIQPATLLLIFSLLFIGAACSANPEIKTTSPITLMDALGRTVELPGQPERIIVGGNGSIMIVDAIYSFPEANDRVIGYAKTDQGHGSFTSLLDTGEAAAIIDNRSSVEETAALSPDLVLLKSYMKDMGDSIEKLGIPVVYMDFESLAQYQRDLTNLGLILGNPERANELIQYFEDTDDFVGEKTQNLSEEAKPNVLFIYYKSKDNAISFNVPPLDWAQTTMVQQAGGIPVWTDVQLESSWTQVNIEQISVWNPEIIFLTAYFDDVSIVKQQLLDDPFWSNLEAVRNGNLFAVPMGFYSWDQPHTRWGLTQLWMASKIQPDLFPDFDFITSARDTYEFLYGINSQSFEENILPKLQGDIDFIKP